MSIHHLHCTVYAEDGRQIGTTLLGFQGLPYSFKDQVKAEEAAKFEQGQIEKHGMRFGGEIRRNVKVEVTGVR